MNGPTAVRPGHTARTRSSSLILRAQDFSFLICIDMFSIFNLQQYFKFAFVTLLGHRRNKSSSRSLARFCRRKHKNSTAALRARGKIWAPLVGKSITWPASMQIYLYLKTNKLCVPNFDSVQSSMLKLQSTSVVVQFSTFFSCFVLYGY